MISMEPPTIQLMPVKMLSSRIAFATACVRAFESLLDIIPSDYRITLRFAQCITPFSYCVVAISRVFFNLVCSSSFASL